MKRVGKILATILVLAATFSLGSIPQASAQRISAPPEPALNVQVVPEVVAVAGKSFTFDVTVIPWRSADYVVEIDGETVDSFTVPKPAPAFFSHRVSSWIRSPGLYSIVVKYAGPRYYGVAEIATLRVYPNPYDSIEDLRENVFELRENLKKLQLENTKLWGKLENVQQELGAVKENVKANKSEIDALWGKVYEIQTKIEQIPIIKSKLENHGERIETLETKVQGIQEEFPLLVEDVDKRIDSLKENFESFKIWTRENLGEVWNSIDELDSELSEIESEVATVERRVSVLEDELGVLKENVSALQEEINQLGIKDEELQNYLDALSDDLDELSSKFQDHRSLTSENFEEIWAKFEKIDSEIDSLRKVVEAHGETIASLENWSEETEQSLDSLSVENEKIWSEFEEVRGEIDNLRDSMNASFEEFSSQLTETNLKVAKLNNSLEDFKDRMGKEVGKLHERDEEILDKLTRETNQLNRKIDDEADRLEGIIDDMEARLSSRISANYEEITKLRERARRLKNLLVWTWISIALGVSIAAFIYFIKRRK